MQKNKPFFQEGQKMASNGSWVSQWSPFSRRIICFTMASRCRSNGAKSRRVAELVRAPDIGDLEILNLANEDR